MVGGVTRASSGRFGRALSFDGSDDRVTTVLNVDQNGASSPAITFEAWVYPTRVGSAGRQIVMSTDNGGFDWALHHEGSMWSVFTGSNAYGSDLAVDVNKWQHIAAVFIPGTGVRICRNGVGRLIASIDYDVSDANLMLGGSTFGGYFAGMIDEVAVYPRELTEAELKQHATSGLYGDNMGDVCDPCPETLAVTCSPSTYLDQDGDGYGVQGSSACTGGVAQLD
jgi:hypothetical protein